MQQTSTTSFSPSFLSHRNIQMVFRELELGNQIDSRWLASVPKHHLLNFAEDVLLLYNIQHQKTFGAEELFLHSVTTPLPEEEARRMVSELIFERRELMRSHNPYEEKLREMGSIEQGDVRGNHPSASTSEL